MAHVAEMTLDDGQVVILVVASTGPAGTQRVGRARGPVTGAAETLQQALARVRPALGAVVDGVRSLPEPPEKVTVEFGITLSADVGVVVARGTTEANFTVTMEWPGPAGPGPSHLPGQRGDAGLA